MKNWGQDIQTWMYQKYEKWQNKYIKDSTIKELKKNGWVLDTKTRYWVHDEAKSMLMDDLVIGHPAEFTAGDYYAYKESNWKVFSLTKQNRDVLKTIVETHITKSAPEQIVHFVIKPENIMTDISIVVKKRNLPPPAQK